MGTRLAFCLDKHYLVQSDRFPSNARQSFQELDIKGNTTLD